MLWSCGSWVLWLSAAIGHAGSTLVLYAAIGVLALVDKDTVSKLLSTQDYGVSAIFAAWLGAAAARCWMRRRGAWPEKLGVVLMCLGAGLVAWLVRGQPTPSVLDSEHIVAFAIGSLDRGSSNAPPGQAHFRLTRPLASWQCASRSSTAPPEAGTTHGPRVSRPS